ALQGTQIIRVPELGAKLLENRPVALLAGMAERRLEVVSQIALDGIVVEQRVIDIEQEYDVGTRVRHVGHQVDLNRSRPEYYDRARTRSPPTPGTCPSNEGRSPGRRAARAFLLQTGCFLPAKPAYQACSRFPRHAPGAITWRDHEISSRDSGAALDDGERRRKSRCATGARRDSACPSVREQQCHSMEEHSASKG